MSGRNGVRNLQHNVEGCGVDVVQPHPHKLVLAPSPDKDDVQRVSSVDHVDLCLVGYTELPAGGAL